MKFHFCGDGDCPDWVLAEIHSSIAVLSSIKLRLLAQNVAKMIIGEEVAEDKVKELSSSNKHDVNIAKSATSCLRFLLITASRHNVDENILDAELQQIGLPKEHSSVICRVLSEHGSNIRKRLLESKLTVNQLESATCNLSKNSNDCVEFEIKIKNEICNGTSTRTNHKINIYKSDVKLLLNELKIIKNVMENYNYQNKYKNKNF